MDYNFIEEEKRFFHIAKSFNVSSIKDDNVKQNLNHLYTMIKILKEFSDNDRRRSNSGES